MHLSRNFIDLRESQRKAANAHSLRLSGLTVLRAWACVMVIAVHVVETFYISPRGELLKEHGIAIGVLGSALRASVPLFVMITGALALPIRGSSFSFLGKRLRRVLLPFLVWSLFYATALFLQGAYDGRTLQKIVLLLPFQFSPYVGHLWYVYMLVGLYLLLPILSTWVERANERELWGALALWGCSLLLPYARRFEPLLFGEAHWNVTSTFYYFSGYVGYLILGYALVRRHQAWVHESPSWKALEGQAEQRQRVRLGQFGSSSEQGVERPKRSIRRCVWALGVFCLGYSVTCVGFLYTFADSQNISQLELFWQFDTINVACMALGLFELALLLRLPNNCISRSIEKFAGASYAIYLAHIFVLVELNRYVGQMDSPWARFLLLTSSTAIVTFLSVSLLGKIPQFGKWIGLQPSIQRTASTGTNS